jgi:hypothetical protein
MGAATLAARAGAVAGDGRAWSGVMPDRAAQGRSRGQEPCAAIFLPGWTARYAFSTSAPSVPCVAVVPNSGCCLAHSRTSRGTATLAPPRRSVTTA